ncbi:hypothetical protein [Acinetobacter sp. YH16053]|uniref:hypothetical protein n=1 Tax=Acinetobacter sp. YH16053 TaxID=2601192 RepID=UPI0015D1BDD4|nr:hypothetical protein [Acinetobacter sp. YH16053]
MKKLLILSSVVACSSVFALDKYQYKFDAKFVEPLQFNVIDANFYLSASTEEAEIVEEDRNDDYEWAVYAPSKNYGTGKIEQFSLGSNSNYNGELNPIVLIGHDHVNCQNDDKTTSSTIIFNAYGKLESISNYWANSPKYSYDGEACNYQNKLSKRPVWLNLITLNTKAVDSFFKLNKAKEKDISLTYNSDQFKTIRFKPTKDTLDPFRKMVHQFEYMRSVSPRGKITYSVMNHLHVCSPAKTYTTRIDFDQNGKFIEIDEVESKFDAALTSFCK